MSRAAFDIVKDRAAYFIYSCKAQAFFSLKPM